MADFIEHHEFVFVVEQNRDAQMKTLLVNELDIDPAKIVPVLYYGGLAISADAIHERVIDHFDKHNLPRLKEVPGGLGA